MIRARSVPRVKIHKNGLATLSGIAHQDLQAILTAASGQTELSLQSAKSQTFGSYDAVQVLQGRRYLLEFLHTVMRRARAALEPTPGLSIAARLAKLKATKALQPKVEQRIA